jgi:hypothetical protein
LEKDKILLVDKVKGMKLTSRLNLKSKGMRLKTLKNNWPKLKRYAQSQKLKRGISENWTNHLEKKVEELRTSKERCFEKSMDCVKKIKTSFANVGAYSSEENFIQGDPEGVIEWLSGEAEAFEEILNDRGDVCAFSGARGVAAILEKAGCEHVKTLAHAEAAFSIDDIKDPSAEANSTGGNFFTDIWENGGRGMTHEIIKKNEKDIHDTRESIKAVEKAAELERRICIT